MSTISPATSSGQPQFPRVSSGLTWLALLVALIALAGSLWLTLGMDLQPCPLCYYQRTFVMAVVGIMAVGLLSGAWRSSPVSLLALPAAAGGLGVAIWHEYLEQIGKLECPKGIIGFGTAPQQSLAAIAILFLLLFIDALRVRVVGGSRILGVLLALLIGGGLTYGAFQSVLPKPQPPKAPYEKKEPNVCRPPYVPKE